MSQETSINSLGNAGITDEESKLVDNILNDINGNDKQSSGENQPSPEQMKMMQQQHQMAMRQQQQAMAQQQAMNQQINAQRQNLVNTNDMIDNIKKEAKNITTVIFLCILFNIDQVNSLFKMQSFFVSESGELNIQSVLLKSLLIGIIYYLVKTYLL
jgi:hypothetical protein